jgi:tetratricopeptide (TPR) repeat protein
MDSRRPTRAACAILVLGVAVMPHALRAQDAAALRQEGFALAYNLDYEKAAARLRTAVSLAPDDPATHRSLATVLWLHMLFRRGAITVDHYLGSFSRARVDLKKTPPELDAEFRAHVARAIQLSEKRAAGRPHDPQSHYDLGVGVGLHASYLATVEGRMLAGFNAARRAYDEHEKVLALDGARKDAGLIVGVYRYVVSTMSLPMRMMAYVAGFGGGRDRGLQMIEETAALGGESKTDALFALVLVYNRERRYGDALRVLQELRRMYPRNRLVLLEAGATAVRGKRGAQADALLTEGLALTAADTRPKMPGEHALWRYKRGAARALMGRAADAEGDLRAATSADAQPWVSGRARVELARLALARGDRTQAARESTQAEKLCGQGNDSACVADARRLLRSAHGR